MSAASSPAPHPDLTVAYLVNRYPAPSHTFIRREIQALERLGCRVLRYSVRPGEVAADSAEEHREREKTLALLGGGKLRLLLLALWVLLLRPRAAWRALTLTLRLGWRADRSLWVHIAYLLEAALLLRHLAGRADLVHAHFGTNSTFVAMLCRELGGPPFSCTMHGPEEFERSDGIHLREKVQRAAFVVAISDFCRSQICRYTPLADWAKITVVRCGVDAAFLADPPAPLPSTPELLWVGRFAPEKGLPVLLEACRLLHAAHVPFHLTLVGGGPLHEWARAQIAAGGLAAAVTLAGWRTSAQIRELLDRSRGLVLASFAEGLPVVLMEALARARPVVATRIAAIPELVEPGTSGWLVSPGRADQLAAAMQALLQTPGAELADLGAAGRQRVSAAHDASREAAALLAAMRRHLGRANPGPANGATR
ncbi:MAG: glycosyltransferase [Planctomycetes bacterium]|nr:glycosyltransferase [Planctomycetota bacterium]